MVFDTYDIKVERSRGGNQKRPRTLAGNKTIPFHHHLVWHAQRGNRRDALAREIKLPSCLSSLPSAVCDFTARLGRKSIFNDPQRGVISQLR